MGSPHKSGRGKRPHLKTSSHLTKKTTMDSSENTSSHPSRCGGGESYRWVTLPSIGTAVKGCHLVPMKVPLSMKEDDISIEEGGLTIRKVKEALARCCACLRQWLRHVQGWLRRRRRPQGRLPLHCRTSPPPGCHGRYGTEGCLRR